MTDQAQKRSRHGLRRELARIRLRGMGAIDKRTVAARDLIAWRSSLVDDLGGESAITTAKGALIEMAVRTRSMLDHVDMYLLGRRSLVDKRKKRLIPIMAERQALADALTRQLIALGLERAANAASSLPSDWIQKVEPTDETAGEEDQQ
jgi:hypothetical protein